MRPFNLERVKDSFDSKGYHYSRDDEEESLSGTWNEVLFRFSSSEEDQWLMVQTRWLAPDELENAEDEIAGMTLQNTANEWNRQFLQPTAYPFPTDDGWVVQLDMAVFFDAPCSDLQIDAALDRAIEVHLQAHEKLPQMLSPVL